jgi:hypothetical protein
MGAQFIEPDLTPGFTLVPAAGEAANSPEFQAELATFAKALHDAGVEVRATWRTQDTIGGGGWSTGEFVLVSVLVRTVIIELRKFLIEYYKLRVGRKVKIGKEIIECPVDDVEKVLTPEAIADLLAPKKPRVKATHER